MPSPAPGDPSESSGWDLPVTSSEVIAVVLLVVLSDLVIYRGEGFAGDAAFFTLAPVFLWIGAASRRCSLMTAGVSVLLLLAAVKLLWSGSWLLVICGWALLFAFSMTLIGQCPYVLETVVFASQAVRYGYEGLREYGAALQRRTDAPQRVPWWNVGLPALALLAFGTIFILANPDLVTFVSKRLEVIATMLREWLAAFAPLEVLFWIAAGWISVGLIRPARANGEQAASDEAALPAEHAPAPLLSAFRNTLLTVITLFAVYLVFEFRTLWFREFPEEFYYTGRVHKYAHEGAAWLTLALAMATAVLSLIFRGATLNDPRLPALKRLAWLWSLENALLAITVYNRLMIYIGFNGMTRMRLVGLFGITCVAVGFALVVWKIAFHKRFLWLLRRHLWTVATAIYLFALIPVDAMVHRYNVSRILAGDPAPSVQLSVHPITSDGYLVLEPLLECDDETIREGIRAILAEKLRDSERLMRPTGTAWLDIVSDRRPPAAGATA